MGCAASTLSIDDENYLMDKYQAKIQQKHRIPLQVIVSHYTPSNFPLVAIINEDISNICKKSWDIICNKEDQDEYGTKTSGITAFYNEFYARLDLVDPNGVIDAVLAKHSSGMNKIASKGAILIRIVKYVLSIKKDDEETQTKLYMLGKSHDKRHIKPYLYAIFVQTLLQTIGSRLDVEASNEVMGAWVNLFAFIIKSMLPPAIKNHIVENELFINTSSIFDNGKIADEVNQIEEMKDFQKKLNKGKTTDGSLSARVSERHAILKIPTTLSARTKNPMNSATNSANNTSRIVPMNSSQNVVDDETKN